jgi:hypothetical protein
LQREIYKRLSHYNKKNKIHEYLGKKLVTIYKKGDQAEQSFHATDVSRSNFLTMLTISLPKIWH